MRVVIEIPEDIYNHIVIDSEYFTPSLVNAFKNGTVLPQNSTNGDMIKAMFPSIEIIDLPRFKEVYTGIPFGKLIGANIDCMRDWWDAPYEREEG